MKDYKDMTMAELEAENRKLMAQKEAIRQKQLEINRLMTEKAAVEAVAQRVATLSDAEKAALMQIIAPKGIESGEEFGRM